MISNIKCAVIGLGHIGCTYAKAIDYAEGAELVAVCDVYDKARNRFTAAYPDIPIYSSVAELLEKVEFEAAFVTTSDPHHATPFIDCLDAGKHLFVEKPVGNSIEDITAMVGAIDRNPHLVAAGGHILRYDPVYRRIQQMASAGEFGEIFYMEGDYHHNLFEQADPSRYNEATGGNWYLDSEMPMTGGGIHQLDLLQWFIGSPAVSVSSLGNSIAFPAMKQNDCIVCLFKFASGAVAKVSALYGLIAPRPPFANVAVYGTRASVWRDQVCYDHERDWEPLVVEKYEERFGHGFEREVADLVHAIRTGQPVLAPARECAQHTLAAIIATQAANSGKELEIPQL